MTPERQEQIIEVHPEVSFAALAGKPMEHSKDNLLGYEERAGLLREELGISLPARRSGFRVARPAKLDDLLDALVAAWSTRRDANGIAGRLPAVPEHDDAGLHMAIVY